MSFPIKINRDPDIRPVVAATDIHVQDWLSRSGLKPIQAKATISLMNLQKVLNS
jgi:hypothetical protein